jgi:formylglycine-generating enzyme required for sulfatase activity/serine/threonine protein kinase
MTATPVNHPPADTLEALGLGQLDDATAAQVLRHLEECPACRRAVAALPGDSFLDKPRDAHGRSGTPAPAGPLSGVARSLYATRWPEGPTPAIPNLPPELLGHPQYEVLRELGRGGMGVVYLARHKRLDRHEVLKVMSQELSAHPGSRARFEREMQAAARLSHTNVVTAYGTPEAGGLLVFAMEFVEGLDLATLVTEERSGRPLSVQDACRYASQVALGLQHAFEKGLVHRDIKPSNLILSRQGNRHVVKITDFGLAKARREGEASTELTGTGVMLGTPDYLAPEQAQDAARADIRADLYSLGCTLYYLLAGRPPFQAKSVFGLMQAHQSQDATPLDEVRPEVPAGLAAVVAKLLAKDPGQRYQTPAEVVQALSPFVRPGGERGGAKVPAPTPEEEGSPFRGLGDAPIRTPPVKGAKTGREAAGTPALVAWAKRPLVLGGAGLAVLLLALLGLGASGVFRVKTADGLRAKVKEVSGIELVAIPQGWFFMGSKADDKDADDDEKPRHKVTISQPFSLGKYMVTVGQFQRFVAATGFKTEAETAGDNNTWKNPGFGQTEGHPVVYVSWHDADAFCRWLAVKTGATVRLPREAEWEYSCRAGTTTKFSFGDNDADLGDYAWYSGNADSKTHPCGLKKPNAFGLYDMHGLAWEWCADGKRTYKNQDETDPEGPTSAGASRVGRGGSWSGVPRRCRAAARGVDAPSFRKVYIGFRVLVSR